MDRAFTSPDLSGQVAIVTGASRGIGRAMALALAECGASVVCAAKTENSRDTLPGTIHETVSAIESAGGKAIAVRTNLRHAEDIENMVSMAVETFGGLDILVNNAGALWLQPVANTKASRFDLLNQVNGRAAMLGAIAAMPHLQNREGRSAAAHIITVSPPLDLKMLPGKTPYLVSKYMQSLMTIGLAGELAGTGVCATSLWPATTVESQATIAHGMGTREIWRTADVVSDAMLAILASDPAEMNGKLLLDEEALAAVGVTDLTAYNCTKNGQPMRIVGAEGRAAWKMLQAGAAQKGTSAS